LFDVKLKTLTIWITNVTQVLKTAQEIASTWKALDDDLIATLLLRGLTPEYKPMCLALENSGVELTTDYINMKLLQEGYNPNPKASYSSENVLVSHYKCRKRTDYNSVILQHTAKLFLKHPVYGNATIRYQYMLQITIAHRRDHILIDRN
jgi:hypothetical protein